MKIIHCRYTNQDISLLYITYESNTVSLYKHGYFFDNVYLINYRKYFILILVPVSDIVSGIIILRMLSLQFLELKHSLLLVLTLLNFSYHYQATNKQSGISEFKFSCCNISGRLWWRLPIFGTTLSSARAMDWKDATRWSCGVTRYEHFLSLNTANKIRIKESMYEYHSDPEVSFSIAKRFLGARDHQWSWHMTTSS